MSVIDYGPGLQLGQPELLLEPFKRGNTRTEGTGLGLSIVSQVMTTHGGTVSLCETPGGGTTVELNFPVPGCRQADQSTGRKAAQAMTEARPDGISAV